MIPQETIIETLRVRRFFLELFNHSYRIHFLEEVNRKKFTPPPKIEIVPLDHAIGRELLLSIGDLGASVIGTQNSRVSRSERYAQGPFIKLGKQARAIFMGSSSPDVWNTAASIATMAASHSFRNSKKRRNDEYRKTSRSGQRNIFLAGKYRESDIKK